MKLLIQAVKSAQINILIQVYIISILYPNKAGALSKVIKKLKYKNFVPW